MRKSDAVYDRWCAAMQREMRDANALNMVLSRALGDSDVRQDPALADRLRQFAATKHAELRAAANRPRQTRPVERPGAFVPEPEPSGPTPAQTQATFRALAKRFHASLAHFEDHEAESLLHQIEQLRADEPDHIEESMVSELTRELAAHGESRRQLQARIEKEASQAIRASERGRHEAAGQLLRGLSSIHAAHPKVLSQEKLDAIRKAVIDASEEFEHRKAVHDIVEKERRIAEEVKGLAGRIHRFHKLARQVPHDGEEFHRAEAEYMKAVREVRSHDGEWLAGVVLELADLLAAWKDPPPEKQDQVNHFIDRVRSSLAHVRTEIKEIDSEIHRKPGH
jgi:hypothetical protein